MVFFPDKWFFFPTGSGSAKPEPRADEFFYCHQSTATYPRSCHNILETDRALYRLDIPSRILGKMAQNSLGNFLNLPSIPVNAVLQLGSRNLVIISHMAWSFYGGKKNRKYPFWVFSRNGFFSRKVKWFFFPDWLYLICIWGRFRAIKIEKCDYEGFLSVLKL